MKEATDQWLKYAAENLQAARWALSSRLFNVCLQNVQQAVEKKLKALRLKSVLEESGVVVDLTEDECESLDSIYLPSKYPLGSAIPDYEPDEDLCNQCIAIAERVEISVNHILLEDSGD